MLAAQELARRPDGAVDARFLGLDVAKRGHARHGVDVAEVGRRPVVEAVEVAGVGNSVAERRLEGKGAQFHGVLPNASDSKGVGKRLDAIHPVGLLFHQLALRTLPVVVALEREGEAHGAPEALAAVRLDGALHGQRVGYRVLGCRHSYSFALRATTPPGCSPYRWKKFPSIAS